MVPKSYRDLSALVCLSCKLDLQFEVHDLVHDEVRFKCPQILVNLVLGYATALNVTYIFFLHETFTSSLLSLSQLLTCIGLPAGLAFEYPIHMPLRQCA